MKKHVVRIGVILVASVLLAFLLEFVQIRTQPPVYEAEERVVSEAETLDFARAELTNAVQDGENIKTGGDGTVILFRFQPAKTLSYVAIESKKHVRSEFQIRISWSRDGETFSDADSTEILANPQTVVWKAEIPEGQYASLKIELDNKLTIRPIRCRDAVTEKVPAPESLRLWRVGILIPSLFFVISVLYWFRAGRRLAAAFRRAAASLKKAGWKIPLRILVFLALSFLAYAALRWVISGAFFGPVDIPRRLFCVLAGLAAGLLLAFPKTLGEKPERLFVFFCLLSGWMLVFLFPNDPFVNWDMEYHFEQTHLYSYLGEERLTLPDTDIVYLENSHDSFNWDERIRSQETQDILYAEGASVVGYKGLMLNSIYDIFPAAGMFLGRVFQLPWRWTLYLSKFFNLLTCALCGFFAIRRLKSGKMILACVLLIPTNIFLASVFSYDHGVTSFMALGMSYFFAEWQEPEKKLTRRNAFVILGCLTFACLTKAFYAPALLFTLFMPKGKWAEIPAERREYLSRKTYALFTCLALLVCLLPYILPMFQGNVVTDMRGGSSAEPMDQVRYILEDPLRFFRLLFSFQSGYLNPANSSGLLTFFAYEGQGPGWQALCVILVLIALTDKKPCDRPLEKKFLTRIMGLFLLYISVCVICFCLYITYTQQKQGTDVILGVQPRYLLPFVFPVLMLFGSGLAAKLLKIDRDWKQRIYNGLAFLGPLVILFNVIYTVCISKFT
uniref:Putative membrane protein (DUF2142) n=1 Tax=uncultured bacterium Contigcl_1774 TaxID=1393661 RepID=W0FRL6_9BACT|nr:putative membrane protein (DUF2142) [uncultured bacterium Contigcl_1774]